MRLGSVLVLAFAVSACGRMGPLHPKPGESLPVKPLMAEAPASPEELLTPPTYARPQRVDELIRRSEPRRADRFDLPPADGGAAPAPPVEPETSSEQAGPTTSDE